jgi:hypothetical protein
LADDARCVDIDRILGLLHVIEGVGGAADPAYHLNGQWHEEVRAALSMGLAELRGSLVALTPDGEAALTGDVRALREAVLRSPELRDVIARLRAARILRTGDPVISCAAAWLVAAGLASWDPDAGLIWDPDPF